MLLGVDAQCGAPVICGTTCGTAGCQSCATCTTPACYQTCCAKPAPPPPPPPPPPPVPTPAPRVLGPTCATFDCGYDWQRTAYNGECPGGTCHKEMCCARMEDCAHTSCPAGWHRKRNPVCKDRCRTEDCCDQEHTCQSHVCKAGTRIHAAYPCPPTGCTDALCCDDVIDVNCRDWFNHQKCKKHWVPLPPNTRCRHESCTHDECCMPEKPADCSKVNCPGNMIHVNPKDRLCGQYQCGVEDCCHEPRPCEKVTCPMFHKKVKSGLCTQSDSSHKDCHWKDCCEPEPSCVDFQCGPTAIKLHQGVCKQGPCSFAQCCETTTTTTTTTCTTCAPQAPVQAPVCTAPACTTCNTCGCR